MFNDDKVRDIKISFLRIEDHLLTHEKVLDCAVVDMERTIGDRTTYKNSAYIVLSTEALELIHRDDKICESLHG